MTYRPNIYYTAAIVAQTEESRAFGEQTVKALQKHGEVLTTHVVRPDLRQWERENEANGVNICDRDFAWENDSDVLVMDATWPMTGGGVEFLYSAGIRNIPSLVVSREGVRISPMVSQFKHPLVAKKTYQGIGDLEQTIDGYFAQLTHGHKLYPNLLIYDAIDGAGKGAIGEALKELGQAKGMRIFDCVDYWKKENNIPTWAEVKALVPGCNLVMTAEPTYAGMGKIIREEIIRKSHPRPYSALSTAFSYSLDRETLYKLLITDALEEGALVGSDRAAVTSEHYQPLQAEQFEGYSREYFLGVVRGLPGNQHALRHAPGLLVLPQVDVAVAQSRLAAREKQDNVRFEVASFQEELAKIYASGRIRKSYERRGTRVVDLLMSKCPTRDDSKREATAILEAYLRENKIL